MTQWDTNNGTLEFGRHSVTTDLKTYIIFLKQKELRDATCKILFSKSPK
jgi:hypothetical protein